MEFELIPYVGVLPLQFGMPREEIQSQLGQSPSLVSGKPFRDNFDILAVNYDAKELASEFCLFPKGLELTLNQQIVLEVGRFRNPLKVLLQYDPEPLQAFGFLIFMALGVSISGYHDGNPAQRAFNVFGKGTYDKFLTKAVPFK